MKQFSMSIPFARPLFTVLLAAFAFLFSTGISAEDKATAPQNTAMPWHAEKARYRIELEAALPNTWMFLDDRTLCLPCSLENGLEIYDEAGVKQKFFRFSDGGIQFDRYKKPQKLFLYFGFPEKAGGGGLDRKIQNDPLLIRQAGIEYGLMPEEWRQYWINDAKNQCENPEVTDDKRAANQNRWAELETIHAEDGLEQDLCAKFGASNTDIRPGRTVLDHRIYEDADRICIAFKGNLIVPESAEYEFRLSSNATRILRIDNASVIRKFGTSPAVESSTAKFTLTAGSHPLLAVYHFLEGDILFSLEWRKSGDPDFAELTERDFSPAPPVLLRNLSDRDGKRYPLCRQDARLVLHLDKTHRATLREFIPLDDASAGCRLSVDGVVFPAESSIFVTEDDKPPKLELIPPAGAEFSPLPFQVRPVDKRCFPVPSSIQMALWAPVFLFDDESLDLIREIRSRMPLSLLVELRETHSAAGPLPQEAEAAANAKDTTPAAPDRTFIRIPAFRDTEFNRFAQDLILKYPMKLNGAELAISPMDVSWTAQLPGFTFDSCNFAVMPVRDIGEFTVGPDGLYDNNGSRRIIPLLHRPTLHELRAWELPRTIAEGLTPTRKVLAAAEDDPAFRVALQKEFDKHGIKLEFFPWNKNHSGRAILESLPAFCRAVQTSNADHVLLIPPSRSRRAAASSRDDARALAFLIQFIRERARVSSIALAPPIPANPALSDPRRDTEFTAELRECKRMYGIHFLELARDFQAIADTPGAFAAAPVKNPEAESVSESALPAAGFDDLARHIVHALLNIRSASAK